MRRFTLDPALALGTPLALALLAGANGAQALGAPALRIKRLDAAQVTERVALVNKHLETGPDGRRRSRWPMWGKRPDELLVIGDNQRDADAVRWQCHEPAPGRAPGPGGVATATATATVTLASPCGRFFVSVLQNVVSQPRQLAADLLAKARPGATRAAWRDGDFGIETDGESYLVHRFSRRKA